MYNFVRGLITEWRRLELPFQNATFVVGVSGGADSLALLLALDELKRTEKLENRFVAAHFNHRLRGDEADSDEEFVRHLTTERKIELAAGHAEISHMGNLEQNARNARYDFLRETAEKIGAYAVLTAHTQNDQAETFLMNLIRGSGPDGLGGMRVSRPLESEKMRNGEERKKDSEDFSPLLPFSSTPILLIRPLLSWAQRSDTEGFCRECKVEYRYDSMNEDLNFTRVRIRKLLLPLLSEFNPKIIETLAGTARLMRRETDREKEKREDGKTGRKGDESQSLSVKELKTLPQDELYTLLREWLGRQRGNLRRLDLKHIEAIERLALSQKSGRIVELPGGEKVVKTGGKLVFKDLKVEKSPSAL